MKPQIFFSSDAGNGSGSAEPVKRLATRYGIPERDVEALLYGSRAPKDETLGFDTKEKAMAEDFRPGYGTTPPRQSWWSPLNVLSVIVGILGILALTIILVRVLQDGRHNYHQFGENMPPPPMMMHPHPAQPPMAPDTAVSAPHGTGMSEKQDDVPSPESPNEMAAKPAPKKHSHSAAAHSTTGYTTSSSIDAEEHLAEMRADGNSKARIHERTKNGITTYSVK